MLAIMPKPRRGPLKVLLVDDHRLLRSGLRQLLTRQLPHVDFGEADSAEAALHEIETASWDVVILDINLPGKDGFAVLEEVTKSCPETAVIMLSMHADNWTIRRARLMGASAFVTKRADTSALAQALHAVLAGDRFFPEIDLSDPYLQLSAQECRVMLFLAQGKRVGEIAAECGLSAKTVSTYKNRLMRKIGVRTLAELVCYVADRRIS